MMWLTSGCTMAPTRLESVYVKPRPGAGLAAAVWPPPSDASCPASITAAVAHWAGLPVTGGVIAGAPPGGPFVAPGVAGPGYQARGYG
jgi:hypothetical protein